MTRVLRVLAKPWVSGLLVAGAVAVGFGLYWFQPWKLWVDDTVDEALPPVAAAPPLQVGPPAAQPDRRLDSGHLRCPRRAGYARRR